MRVVDSIRNNNYPKKLLYHHHFLLLALADGMIRSISEDASLGRTMRMVDRWKIRLKNRRSDRVQLWVRLTVEHKLPGIGMWKAWPTTQLDLNHNGLWRHF